MATNILDQELCTSNVVSLSAEPNSSSFQDCNTDLVSEITAGCISGCVMPAIEENSTPKSKYHTGGGITCCVPNCFNNSVRNKELSFYVIPRDNRLRNEWLHMLRRKNFVPSSSHRVCSVHFVGGRKTYMNNIPTLNTPVRESKQSTTAKPRKTKNSTEGRIKSVLLPRKLEFSQPDVNIENMDPGEVTELKRLQKENQELKDIIQKLKQEHNKKVEALTNEITELNQKLKKSEFSLERFKDDPKLFMFYTGFQSYDLFKTFFEFLRPAAGKLIYWGSNTKNDDSATLESSKRGPKRRMSPEQELFIVLTRLRCGILEQDLAARCKLSTSHIGRICITWIDLLHSHLRAIPIWASRANIQSNMPSCFRSSYPKTRVILDRTEIFIEMASSFRTQSATFSSYKHSNTAKGLIGIAPNGAITFVSELYPGRTSDQNVTKHSGVLQLLEHGDSVMADRGFDISEDLPEGVTLNIPPFMNGKDQLSVEEETETRRIASVRIHVERAIERVIEYYKAGTQQA